MSAKRRTSIVMIALGVALAGAGLAGCEDDGGAPGWNAGLSDGGAMVGDAAGPRDAPAGDAAGGDGAALDAGARDATVF